MRSSLVLVAVSGVAVGFLLVFAAVYKQPPVSRATPPSSAPRIDVRPPPAAVASPPPEDTRGTALFDRNRDMPSDPDLAAEFDDVNASYFHNVLPATVVRWEGGLEELGPLIAEHFTVQGLTDGRVILLNPVVMHDADQRRRALCHEMVHVAVWTQDTAHGPVFQDQLRQLSLLGAFKGIVSSEEEKDATLARLQQARTRIENDERALGRDRESLDRTSEAAVEDYNARLRRQQEAVNAYNHLVDQYNLMAAYPDGLAQERLKPRADGTTR